MNRPHKKHIIDPHLIFLDSESTYSAFNNPTFITNIRPYKGGWSIEVHTNDARKKFSLIGDTQYFNIICFNPQLLANILLLALVSKLYRVTMDSQVSHAMHVHLHDDLVMTFFEIPNGLYYHNTKASQSDRNSYAVNAYSFINNLADNKSNYTMRQVKEADMAVSFNK